MNKIKIETDGGLEPPTVFYIWLLCCVESAVGCLYKLRVALCPMPVLKIGSPSCK
jgi:hypothetical protein